MELGRFVFILNRGVIQGSNPLAQADFNIETQAYGMQGVNLSESLALCATIQSEAAKILVNILAAQGRRPVDGVKGVVRK